VERSLPLFTDNHVRQPIVTALRSRGWTILRSIEVFPERTKDGVLFEHAAREGLVFVTSDEGIHAIAHAWLKSGRPFRMVFWKFAHHMRMSDGDFVRALQELAQRDDAFRYSIEYITPKP
jgi:hypothetical protein